MNFFILKTKTSLSILPLAAAVLGCQTVIEPTSPAAPNVVVIFLDDAAKFFLPMLKPAQKNQFKFLKEILV